MNIQDRIYDSRDDVKKLILSVINGKVKEVELPFNNIKHYIDIIKLLGVDYSYRTVDKTYVCAIFYEDDLEFHLHGDMFDSNTLTFSISE